MFDLKLKVICIPEMLSFWGPQQACHLQMRLLPKYLFDADKLDIWFVSSVN